jgi:hypothetical protein
MHYLFKPTYKTSLLANRTGLYKLENPRVDVDVGAAAGIDTQQVELRGFRNTSTLALTRRQDIQLS